jgi:hypothetical protein
VRANTGRAAESFGSEDRSANAISVYLSWSQNGPRLRHSCDHSGAVPPRRAFRLRTCRETHHFSRGRASAATWYYNTREGMTLEELQRWLGHATIRSTESYVRPSPIQQAKKFARAHANSCMVEVLIDREAIMSGAAAAGAPWKYYPLGNGDFCTNPLSQICPHRMACARREFHLPAASQEGTALVAKCDLQRMLEEMPLDPDERAAIEGVVEAMDNLIAKLRNVPTPDGRTPAEIDQQSLVTGSRYAQ